MAKATVSPCAQDALKSAAVNGLSVRLTCGQLDRKTYEEVNKILTLMGGKWKGGKTAAHVFDRDPTPLLAEYRESGKTPPENPLAFFETPAAVADRMIGLADIPNSEIDTVRILEPSAGKGAILKRVISAAGAGHILQAVEVDPVRFAAVKTIVGDALNADFLTLNPDPEIAPDRVMMNPPFTSDSDQIAYVAHIRHAFGFLRSGGRLVAVAPAGFTFAQTKTLRDFLGFVEEHGHWEELPPGAFKASGTGVNCVLIVLNK